MRTGENLRELADRAEQLLDEPVRATRDTASSLSSPDADEFTQHRQLH